MGIQLLYLTSRLVYDNTKKFWQDIETLESIVIANIYKNVIEGYASLITHQKKLKEIRVSDLQQASAQAEKKIACSECWQDLAEAGHFDEAFKKITNQKDLFNFLYRILPLFSKPEKLVKYVKYLNQLQDRHERILLRNEIPPEVIEASVKMYFEGNLRDVFELCLLIADSKRRLELCELIVFESIRRKEYENTFDFIMKAPEQIKQKALQLIPEEAIELQFVRLLSEQQYEFAFMLASGYKNKETILNARCTVITELVLLKLESRAKRLTDTLTNEQRVELGKRMVLENTERKGS